MTEHIHIIITSVKEVYHVIPTQFQVKPLETLPSPLPSQKSSSLRALDFAAPGHPMASPDSTLTSPPNTISDTEYTSRRHEQTASSTLLNFFPQNFPIPKSSSTEASVSASRALTDALANPRPASFAQIDYAQLQYIQQLARIFNHAIQQATAVLPSTHDAIPATVPAAPPRVPVHLAPSPRVPVYAPPPRVTPSPTPSWMSIRFTSPNLIEPYHNDPTAH